MANKQRSRSRKSGPSRDRTPHFVAPVLDPTWQSPYAPSIAERDANAHAVRSFAMRKKLPQTIAVVVVVLALVVGAVAMWWLALLGLLLAILFFVDLRRSLAGFDKRGQVLSSQVAAQFRAGGTAKDRLRLSTVLDRLGPTFGVDHVSTFIIEEPGYNATLVPDETGLSLFVTSGLVADFELIELEGVVAHCLARQRLGLLERQSVSAVSNLSDAARAALAGPGMAYRADEVAAASIRYPLGIAGALRRCERQMPRASSFFATPNFAQWRWTWFDVWADRAERDLADLDDVELRALALEEW